jgi:hypothetical protein
VSSHSFASPPCKCREHKLSRPPRKQKPWPTALMQFQPVNDPSDPAPTEVVSEAMRAYEYATASEPKLTSPSEVLQAIKGLKFGKAPGPERYTEQGPETSTHARDNLSHESV